MRQTTGASASTKPAAHRAAATTDRGNATDPGGTVLTIEQKQQRRERREDEKVRAREGREAEREPGREPRRERAAEGERERGGGQQHGERRLVELAGEEHVGLVEREAERRDTADRRPADAAAEQSHSDTRAGAAGDVEEAREQQVAPAQSIDDGEHVRIERVHVERPLSDPFAGGDASCPGVVVLGIDHEPVEPRRLAQLEQVRHPQHDAEGDDTQQPPATRENPHQPVRPRHGRGLSQAVSGRARRGARCGSARRRAKVRAMSRIAAPEALSPRF